MTEKRYELTDEEIDDMSNEELEELREQYSQEYFTGHDDIRHHHLTSREKTLVRSNLVRLHKALTLRGEKPKRIERG